MVRGTGSHPPSGTRPHLCPSLLSCSGGVANLPRLRLPPLSLLLKAQGPITFSLPCKFDIHPVLSLLTNKHLPLQPLQSVLDSPNTHKTPLWYSNTLSAGQSTVCLNHMCPWEIFMVLFFSSCFLLFPFKRSFQPVLHSTQEIHFPIPLPHTVLGQLGPSAPFCGPRRAALSRRSAATAEPL